MPANSNNKALLAQPLAAVSAIFDNAAKPSVTPAKTAKPATTAKPIIAAKPAEAPEAANLINEALQALRASVAVQYNGPSLAVHGRKAPKLSDCIARAATPVQIAASLSDRDNSLLTQIKSTADAKTGQFNPVALYADLGVISRLASLGHVRTNGTALYYVKPVSVSVTA